MTKNRFDVCGRCAPLRSLRLWLQVPFTTEDAGSGQPDRRLRRPEVSVLEQQFVTLFRNEHVFLLSKKSSATDSCGEQRGSSVHLNGTVTRCPGASFAH